MPKFYARLTSSIHIERIVSVDAETEEEAIKQINYLGYGSLPVDDDILDHSKWRKFPIDPNGITIKYTWKDKE